MLVLGLTILVAVVSLVLVIVINKKIRENETNRKWNENERLISNLIYPAIFLVFSVIGLVFELALLPNKSYKQEIIDQYNNLNDFIYCSGVDGVEERVLDMNNKIDANKLYHDNIWIGIWYNEGIGNLEKITCKE